MKTTDNYKKHTSNNPAQKLLINNFYKAFVKLITEVKPSSVLDVGCGEGFTLNKLYLNKVGKRLEGVDYSKVAVGLGKKNNKHLVLKQGDIYKLPYKASEFDMVLCMEVLEHLEEPEIALKELIRVSNKYLILSVPNEPWFMLANLLRGKNIMRFGNDIEHINHWTRIGFMSMLKRHGLKIRKIHNPFPWTMILAEK